MFCRYLIISSAALFFLNSTTASAGVMVSLITKAGNGGSFVSGGGTSPGQAYVVGDTRSTSMASIRTQSLGVASEGSVGVIAQTNVVWTAGRSPSPPASGVASARASFDDAFTIRNGLLPVSQQDILANGPIILDFFLTGTVFGTSTRVRSDLHVLQGIIELKYGLSASGGLFVSQRRDYGYRSLKTNVTAFNDVQDIDFAVHLPAQPSDPTLARYDYSGSIEVNLRSLAGNYSADFGQTFELSRISFANGMTPEDLGYTIVFDSGRASPNITAVPEPSSIAIFLGATFSGVFLRRPRRKHHTPV